MQPNKLTPGSNLLFSSSRFMIPQHIEQTIKQEKEQRKKNRPILDEQEIDGILQHISDSFMNNTQISIILFGEYEDIVITGTVTRIDQQLKRLKIEIGQDWEWVKFSDIVGIQ